MDRYDYKDEAGDIGFNLVPVVENWDALRALRSTKLTNFCTKISNRCYN